MKKVIITFTVDWEGDDFESIDDLIELRKYIGKNVPATYFICPAYFTKGIQHVSENINKATMPNDEIALHIHNYRSLIDYCGLTFRTEPDFYEPYSKKIQKLINKLPKFLRSPNTGRGIPLSAYEPDEIIKILNKSKEILLSNLNISELTSFRAGGWMASDNVFTALEKTGFKFDSSAAPPEILSQGYSFENNGNFLDDYNNNNRSWTEFIIKLWGYKEQEEYFLRNSFSLKNCPDKAIRKLTQPYKINSLIEMPNNCGVSDYASGRKTMRPVLEHAINKIKNGSNKHFFINIGCHQEGDYIYKRPIADFFKSITDQERQYIEFKNLKDAGEMAKIEIRKNNKFKQ